MFLNLLGLVPSAVASNIGGDGLMVVLLIMVMMAVTSTGSAEVVAVASILVYDVYVVYLKVITQHNSSTRHLQEIC